MNSPNKKAGYDYPACYVLHKSINHFVQAVGKYNKKPLVPVKLTVQVDQ